MKKANKNTVKYSYLQGDRLADVIRLITLLAKTELFTFREIKGIGIDLNGPPKSAVGWFELAAEHPEFFRFSQDGERLVLLLRFVSRIIVNQQEQYPALSIDQTQKLVEQAITLHDKQLQLYQRNDFKVPLWTAVIAAIVTLVTTVFSWYSTKEINQRLDLMTKKMDSVTVRKSIPATVIKPDSVSRTR